MNFDEVFNYLKSYFTDNHPTFRYFDKADWYQINSDTFPGINTPIGYHLSIKNSTINDNYFVISWTFSFAIDNRSNDHNIQLNNVYNALIDMLTYSFPFTAIDIGFSNTKDVFVKDDTAVNKRPEYSIYHFNNIVTTVNHNLNLLFDYDGNIYPTKEIGGQTWMIAPLRVTHLNDGSEIPIVKSNTDWLALTDNGYCAYNNDDADVQSYGLLYNGYAAQHSNIAPLGWRVPTDNDFKILEQFLGMSVSQSNAIGDRGTDEGGKLKSTGTNNWKTPNTGATNLSGMNVYPNGYRNGVDANLYYKFYQSYIWTKTLNITKIYYRKLSYDKQTILRSSLHKTAGCSIYCVK